MKKHVSAHAPFAVRKLDGMTLREEVVFTVLLVVGMSLTFGFGVWWFWPTHIPSNWHGPPHIFDYLLFAVLSYIVWQQISMEVFSWYIAEHVKIPDSNITPQEGMRVAYVTAFVPGAEPYDVLERTLRAMSAVNYPHDTWLLDEGDDETAREICERYGVKHFSRKGKYKLNTKDGKYKARTKGGNYNAWLSLYIDYYDIVAQHDIDFVPRKDFLMRTLGYFRDASTAFVGTPQVYGNTDASWIARGAAEQTYGFYGPLQKGFYGHDMTLLIGANHIFRTAAYHDIDGYTTHITEDMLTGMKLYTLKHKWKSVYVPEVLLVGEGPTTWTSYFGQQMRWAYGCMDIVFRHAPSLMPKMRLTHMFNYVWLQQFYFSGVAQVAGILMLTLYFFFGITPSNMATSPVFELYVPLLVFQLLFQLWLQRFNTDPEHERGLLLRGRLLSLAVWPIYFLAFLGVVRGKRLTYVVTPKGDTRATTYTPRLFLIHFILGSITLLGIQIGFITHHTGGPMIFWAVLNTLAMYAFVVAESIPAVVVSSRRRYQENLRRLHMLEYIEYADRHRYES